MFIEKDIMVLTILKGFFELLYARICVCQGGANGGNSWAASSRPHGGREEGGGNSNWAANWKAFPKQTTMANNRNLQTLLNFHSVTLQKHTKAAATEHQCQKSAKSTQVQQLQASNGGGKAKFARGATFWSNIWFHAKHIESADLEFDSPPNSPPAYIASSPIQWLHWHFWLPITHRPACDTRNVSVMGADLI